MKKQAFLFLAAVIFFAATADAQNKGSEYTTSLGIKFLDGAGITLKHFINEKDALEGIGFFWNQGTRITGLYEIHYDINGAPGLKWYVGPGAHIGFYNSKFGGSTWIGVDGVLGLDYKIRNAPLNLSLDWQPSFEFGASRGFTGNWGGFAVRYTF